MLSDIPFETFVKGILKGTSLFHIKTLRKPCKFRKKQSPAKQYPCLVTKQIQMNSL